MLTYMILYWMIEGFIDKLTVVVLDRIVFENTGWYHSTPNEIWISSKDWSGNEICVLLQKFVC